MATEFFKMKDKDKLCKAEEVEELLKKQRYNIARYVLNVVSFLARALARDNIEYSNLADKESSRFIEGYPDDSDTEARNKESEEDTGIQKDGDNI